MRRPPLIRFAGIITLTVAAVLVASQMLGGPVGYVIVSGASMEPTLRTGDLALVLRGDAYRRGDVVTFRVPRGEAGAGSVVIHRIVGGSDRAGYLTQGDNRSGRDPWRPTSNDVLGRMILGIPQVGRVPALLATPLGLALAAAALGFLLVARGGSAKQDVEAETVPIQATHPPRSQPVVAPAAAVEDRGSLALAAGLAAGAGLLIVAVHAARRR